MVRHVFFLAAITTFLLAPAARADEHYAFDKAHTQIVFSVDSFWFSHITGAFTVYDGDFVFCLAHPDKNGISITLYSKGIHTPDGERDEEMQGPHFFDAARFPDVRFISTGVKFTGANDADVSGNLTLRGITRPMTLQVHFLKTDSDPANGAYAVDFTATGTISRSDFGMDYLDPLIGDDVKIRIETAGRDEDGDKDSGKK
jgi:polyisoprenoid-binding protein YceI